ncbi:MAG: alpha/beta hydrolase, partial [Cardiobacterium sp.]
MTATLHYQNAELSYQLGGKADAPAIVLLHGGLGSAEDFA